MSKLVLSRRMVLRGILGGIAASVALPPLDAMLDSTGTAYANGGAIEKIFGTWFWGNGIKVDQFHPTQTGANFAVSDALKAFLDVDPALRAHLSTVSNATLRWKVENVHHSPVAGVLSASNYGKLGSIDHVIAARWQARPNPSDIASLVLRSAGEFSDKYNIGTSFTPGATSMNEFYKRRKVCEYDAAAVFKRIFGVTSGSASPAAGPDPEALARADVLDIVKDDLAALKARVGTEDAQRLDAHFTNIAELQKSFRSAPGAVPAGFTVAPHVKAQGQINEVEKNGKELNRVLALALAMGKTRVFSMTWSGPQNNAIFKDAGVNLENHKMTHEIKSIPKSQRPVMQHKIVRLSMAHLGHLAKQLMGYKVGAGTLLDQCVILGTSELGNACDQHSSRDTPLLLVGKGGGTLKGNYHHRAASGDDNACKILLTVLKALGETDTTYGTTENGSEGKVTSPFGPLLV